MLFAFVLKLDHPKRGSAHRSVLRSQAEACFDLHGFKRSLILKEASIPRVPSDAESRGQEIRILSKREMSNSLPTTDWNTFPSASRSATPDPPGPPWGMRSYEFQSGQPNRESWLTWVGQNGTLVRGVVRRNCSRNFDDSERELVTTRTVVIERNLIYNNS